MFRIMFWRPVAETEKLPVADLRNTELDRAVAGVLPSEASSGAGVGDADG